MASTDPFYKIVKGYPKLAAKIEIQPEIAIYRRFGALNAQNLLYLQAELEMLEIKLRDQQIQDDNDRNGKGPDYAKDWYWLRESENSGNDKQLRIVLQIRASLKAYNDALIQQATILSYPKPGEWDLHYLQDYLHTPDMGPLVLSGEDANIWGTKISRESHKPDLITLRPRAKTDRFSVWATENTIFNLLRCGCARFMTFSKVHGAVGYEDDAIYRITYWITSIIASLIPITSIAVLYCVQSMPARLAIIATFNVLVSVCLMGLTDAKRAEIFAITAAFAAVQVVFVGTDKST